MDFEHQEDIKIDVTVQTLSEKEGSFEAFFKEHFVSLCVYCQIRYGFDLDQCREIVHTSFIKLWEVRASLKPDVKLKSYMQKIVSNKALDLIKHHRVHQKHEKIYSYIEKDVYTDGFEDLEYKELLTDVNATITEMPDQMRTIFEMSRYEHLKYHEIATKLGISPKTVETQMSRALAKLRLKLARFMYPATLLFIYVSLHF
ncbi:RNA polymerase sigma-70 factor, ECF subfamily [Chitinophaga jiangningensis]|uniref:RNA polymerase sigma-70 factor, ECF subfamily n=1 Tax=Chitinophaga jiangningensis TaxID=1419482 RepID=A0A1M7C368_9BACT|nr:RNA polymerase sigma-70 factor [Chitinophaga jiangningensis]SHL61617.1 RNA polymerase sigma-70 factor, ECF subfamily [Chitinophaga jiangningensis]